MEPIIVPLFVPACTLLPDSSITVSLSRGNNLLRA
jgi:hypothetical protein